MGDTFSGRMGDKVDLNCALLNASSSFDFEAPARPPEAPGCAMYSLHNPLQRCEVVPPRSRAAAEFAELVFDAHVALVQSTDLLDAEVHVPQAVVDRLEPHVFADQ